MSSKSTAKPNEPNTRPKARVLEMPKPKFQGITQERLKQLEQLIDKWESEGGRIGEDSAQIIAELQAGAGIEAGPLRARIDLSNARGPEVKVRLIIE